MKTLILMLIGTLLFSFSYGQGKANPNEVKIKETILNFLNWYRLEQIADTTKKTDTVKMYKEIVVRKQLDTMIKVSIDMKEVENYLGYLKSSNCLSNTFLNNLRQYHQIIANEVELSPPYPAKEGTFAIPGFNCDVIFGFEPEEILDHIKEGRFTKIYILYDKAIVKFDVTNLNQYLFTMTKVDDKWLIDDFGLDRTNLDKLH